MKNLFVTHDIALKVKELGFNEPCLGCLNNNHDIYGDSKLEYYASQEKVQYMFGFKVILAPTWDQIVEWLETKGYYIHIISEFYTTGINWNWQVLWYLPKEEWTKFNICGGTGLYGDNGEYPTRKLALESAILKAIELIKNK